MPQPLASAVKRCAGGSFIASSIPGCGFDAPAMNASCSRNVASASGKKRSGPVHLTIAPAIASTGWSMNGVSLYDTRPVSTKSRFSSSCESLVNCAQCPQVKAPNSSSLIGASGLPITRPSPSTRTTCDQLLPAGGATFATTSCSLAGSVVPPPQPASASAPSEDRRAIRSDAFIFIFLHEVGNIGLLRALEREVEFRFERGPGGNPGVAAVDEKAGGSLDPVGGPPDVGHPGEFGLRDFAVERGVDLCRGIAARAHQRGQPRVGGNLARARLY